MTKGTSEYFGGDARASIGAVQSTGTNIDDGATESTPIGCVAQWECTTLPSGWQQVAVEDGVYYWCPSIGVVQWEWPALPSGWEAIESEFGMYYYCPESEVAQWEWPSPMQQRAVATVLATHGYSKSNVATAQRLAHWIATAHVAALSTNEDA